MWDATSSRLGRMTWPMSTMSVKKLHFFGMRVVPVLLRSDKTFRTCLVYCFGILLNITMSSRYTKASCYVTLERMTSIVRWNVLGLMQSPKKILTNWYNACSHVKAVLFLMLSSTSIYQCWLLASNVENTATLPSKSVHMFIREIGYEPRLVTALGFQVSTQNWRFPSILGMITMGVAHLVCVGSMMFLASILSISIFKHLSFRAGTVCRGAYGCCVWNQKFNAVFSYVDASLVIVPQRLEFQRYVG